MESLLVDIHKCLGINDDHLKMNRLTLQKQPKLEDLQVVEIDYEGKPFVLVSGAAKAWLEMKSKAIESNIMLMPFSGFRSYLHQKNLIERHLKNGRSLEDIFTQIAIPGYSEHHSGKAVDVHTKEKALLEEEFENSQEFNWLMKNAFNFGFKLSYPRSNPFGIIYEPWHWLYIGS